MLKLFVPAREWFNEETQEFVTQSKPCELMLEHSLLSLSKWESKWKKPFLGEKVAKSDEEFLDYIRCMTINQNVDTLVYYNLTAQHIRQIQEYIEDPMSATTVRHKQNKRPGGAKKIVTSELIYSWMIRYGVPFECQKWHLNRLMKLIDVCVAENGEKEKMSPAEVMRQNHAINASRKAKHKTKG